MGALSSVARPRQSHRSLWLAAAGLFAGFALGLLQPLVFVAIGVGIVAGPTYLGLFLLLCMAVFVVGGLVALVSASSRDLSVPAVILSACLVVGMVGGNVVASSLHISFAARVPTPTPRAPTGLGWSPTGSLLMGRYDHTTTLLADGRVLVAGGTTHEGPTNSAELFDAKTGRWTETGSMRRPGPQNTALRLADGRVLVLSRDGSNAELYDPARGRWDATGGLVARRFGYTATLLLDGRVLVAGGTSPGTDRALSSAELYDPATGAWTTTGSMSGARSSHAAVRLRDGRVLVAGGPFTGAMPVGSGATTDPAAAAAELYDPATGRWSTTGVMTAQRAGSIALVCLADGRALLLGGSGTAPTEIWDPATGDWRLAGMAQNWALNGAVLLNDGRVLSSGLLGSMEIYDPRSGTAKELASTNHGNVPPTLLADGRVLFAGGAQLRGNGMGVTSDILATAHIYDPRQAP